MMRKNLVRLAIILGFGILGGWLSLYLGQEPQKRAYAQDETGFPGVAVVANQTIQNCAECHLDIVAYWQTSPHALAYHNEAFQSAWHDQGGDANCLKCHTTGYSPRTQTYAQMGVTCEACHGQTPLLHPGEPVPLQPATEVCADCHTTTFTEWELSGHGEAEHACSVCHNPHPQQIRFETSTQLCLDCHQESPSYVHVSHTEQACTDCHWHRGYANTQEHIITGDLMYTGHDSAVETLACTDCHANTSEGYAQARAVLLAQRHGVDAQIHISELEAEADNMRAQGQNHAAVQLIQGLLAGLFVGTVLTLGAVRVIKL